MNTEVIGAHIQDGEGNPLGGITEHRGIRIDWQHGPLRDCCDRPSPTQEHAGSCDGVVKPRPANGAFVEDVIWAAIDRLMFYQSSKYACVHNDIAIRMLHVALDVLAWRTKTREARGVEGLHQV